MKRLNLNSKVSEAIKLYPELIEIIADLGFPQVRNAFLRNMFASSYTVSQAIDHSGLGRVDVINMLIEKGFTIE